MIDFPRKYMSAREISNYISMSTPRIKIIARREGFRRRMGNGWHRQNRFMAHTINTDDFNEYLKKFNP